MATSLRDWVRREVYGAEENRGLRAFFAWMGFAVFFIPLLVLNLREIDLSLLTIFSFVLVSLFIVPPLLFYVRLIRTLAASFLTGLSMVAVNSWVMFYVLTSSSSTAGLAFLSVPVYNFAVLAGGWLLDRFLLRQGPPSGAGR